MRVNYLNPSQQLSVDVKNFVANAPAATTQGVTYVQNALTASDPF